MNPLRHRSQQDSFGSEYRMPAFHARPATWTSHDNGKPGTRSSVHPPPLSIQIATTDLSPSHFPLRGASFPSDLTPPPSPPPSTLPPYNQPSPRLLLLLISPPLSPNSPPIAKTSYSRPTTPTYHTPPNTSPAPSSPPPPSQSPAPAPISHSRRS